MSRRQKRSPTVSTLQKSPGKIILKHLHLSRADVFLYKSLQSNAIGENIKVKILKKKLKNQKSRDRFCA